LQKMINSPDKESADLAHEIMGNKIALKSSEGLNNDQLKAFMEIINFFENTDDEVDAFVLEGHAGTGKTYLVKRLLEYVTNRYPRRRVAITAPTNKAVKVLHERAPFSNKNKKEL